MSMRFFYNNLVDASGVTFTATSEQSDLPVENVAHEHRGRVWRTTGSATTERVVIDLGSAQAATAFLFIHADTWASYANVKLEAHTSDSWGSPAFTQAISSDLARGVTAVVFSSQSYRYWRFSFDKPSAGTLADVGRIFLGTYTDISEPFDYGQFEQGRKDLSVTYRSIGGQTWSDEREQYRTFSGRISAASQASSDSLQTIASAVGEHTPFFVRLDTDDSQDLPTGEYLYVKFSDLKGREVDAYDSEYKWQLQLELEEQI